MKNELLQVVRIFLIETIEPDFIIIFGSYATGNTHSESDLDIAFYHSTQNFSSYERFMIAQKLAGLIGIEVDLIDLKEASTVFAMQIYSTGKVLYSNNERLRMELEMRTYSMYARLNEERQPILDQIQETGSVYYD